MPKTPQEMTQGMQDALNSLDRDYLAREEERRKKLVASPEPSENENLGALARQRLLDPLFKEKMIKSQHSGMAGTDQYVPPVNTAIRNYVPNPRAIGDFGFKKPMDEISNYWEWKKRNPATDL
jgi:hypothetical protein